jgi:4-amino-4-deoxy-L-arabinose transferase-like glycosyltransferase
MPLPFYVLGASQLVWGRSLIAARLASLALGLGALILVTVIARHISGDTAGLLAAAFFATQGVLVGYLSTATYFSLSALILLTGLARSSVDRLKRRAFSPCSCCLCWF